MNRTNPDNQNEQLTIADEQAKFQGWYGEWLSWETGEWKDKTPESLLSYFKTRLCVTLGHQP